MDSTKDNKNNENDKFQIAGITGIGVEGFKSIHQFTNLEIRPLTILAGANSSGKSSVMQPLLMLKQTLEASYDPGPLLLHGPNVQFTSAKQFLSKTVSNKQVNKFSIALQESDDDILITTYKKKKGMDIAIESMQIKNSKLKVKLNPQMSVEKILRELPHYSRLFESTSKTRNSTNLYVKRTRCFLNVEAHSNFSPLPPPFNFNPSEPFAENIRRLIHLPGLRGNPTRTYKTTAFGSVFPGTFENYVASIIYHWQKAKDERVKTLENFLAILGLTDKLEAKQLDDTQVELQINRLAHKNQSNGKNMVNITDVGLGVSQVLPVLVAVLTAEPGQLVYIEQPEIHLHPRAQAALAKIFVEAIKRNIRLVVETHSALLLTAIQATVAKGDVEGEKVMLHWFECNADGETNVSSTTMDEVGAFGDWPEDFAEVSLQVESDYLEAAELRLLEQENG